MFEVWLRGILRNSDDCLLVHYLLLVQFNRIFSVNKLVAKLILLDEHLA